ncbi:sodium/proline symporter [Anaerotignum neopropionicum]|uniref:Sodium/proline symporter n=1 Tax=Anaerotignum neopropionicum TaxID=36847 RepID=A0A136WHK6_9FIRM|nr:sodium/proline symporter PutP [Anaerotignum neopropionicum]KXL53967.1 sodium/proline symporter [Anaerotignum neopropionicum]
MSSAQVCIMLAIAVYLSVMVAIGIYWSKKNENVGDFYLGGRKLGPFVTAMSAEASDMSSWLLMGLPGVAYLCGIADPAWTAIGLAIGTYINWLFVAKRIRIYTHEAQNSITLPDFFSRRYKDDKNILMCIGAVVIIIFFIPYTASGFAACGKLFSSLFGVSYHSAMIISAIVIVAYTATGGFSAASTTDLIQSIVMTIALFVVVIFGIIVAGGLDTVMSNARALPGYLSLTSMYSASANSATPYGFLTICSTMAWGLGYFGMPHILLRFMAIEDTQKLTLSRRIATVWVVISMTVAIFIGVVGYSVSKVGAVPVLEGSASETIIVQIANLLSQSNILTALIAGVILAGILAATMSTADSQLLAASSSVSHNLLQTFFGIKMSEKKAMTVARCSVVVISIIAAFIARDPASSVFAIVSFAWAGFGAAFGPVVLTALFWRRSNKQGALAGMVAGGAMVFLWKYFVRPMGGAWNIYELLPAFLVSFAAIIIVSLMTKAPEKEVTDVFDRVKMMCTGK